MKITSESILDNKTLFYYIIILIGIIFAFSKIEIGLNIIFGTLIGFVIIYYLYNTYTQKQQNENNIKSFQQSVLLPKSEIISKYDDIVKYLFSIQDFYIVNPPTYEIMMKSLENFFNVYEETNNNKKYAGRNYELMMEHKRSTQNALHSIIYNCPTDVLYTNKLSDAIVIIGEILDNYLDKVERIQKEYLYENGYNINTILINKSGILPKNSYDNDNNLFTYELY